MKEAFIIVAKCGHGKSNYAIRTEKKQGRWHFTWAFKMPDAALAKEGYDKTSISGAIEIDSEYPGCPYCRSTGFFQCGRCGRVNCYDGDANEVTCGWCGNRSGLQSVESFDNIKGGDY